MPIAHHRSHTMAVIQNIRSLTSYYIHLKYRNLIVTFHIPRMLDQEEIEEDLLGLYLLSQYFFKLSLLTFQWFSVNHMLHFDFLLSWSDAAQRLVVTELIFFYITC